ncbi:MAG: hypothetical protein AAGG50_04245 [Bacteroidota bacterium]
MPDETGDASHRSIDAPGETSRPAWHMGRHPERRPHRLVRRLDDIGHAEKGICRQPDGAVHV